MCDFPPGRSTQLHPSSSQPSNPLPSPHIPYKWRQRNVSLKRSSPLSSSSIFFAFFPPISCYFFVFFIHPFFCFDHSIFLLFNHFTFPVFLLFCSFWSFTTFAICLSCHTQNHLKFRECPSTSIPSLNNIHEPSFNCSSRKSL